MSRSGYSEDYDWGDNPEWAMIRWRGAVKAALCGARGQAFLAELIAALEAMPEKRLISHELEAKGEVCAIGSVGKRRGLDMSALDAEDWDSVAGAFGIASAMVREIVYENDEGVWKETPEQRHARMLKWAKAHLKSL